MSTAVILGAGLAGLTTAQALQERGWEVAVVDAYSAPALGTSFANAGMLTPSMSDPWNSPGLLPYLLKSVGKEESAFLLRLGALPGMLSWCIRFLAHSGTSDYRAACLANFQLATFSLQALQRWEQDLGLSFEQRSNGTLKLFREPKTQTQSLRVAEQLSGFGLAHESLSPAQAVELEPSLAPVAKSLSGAIYYPQDSSGNAHLFCESLARRLASKGVHFAYNSPFKRWLWKGQTLVGFETNNAQYRADAIILATGANSSALLKPLDLDLPVQPIKGYSLTLGANGLSELPIRPLIDEALHCAITPFDSTLRIAGTAEIAGYGRQKTPARIENLRQMVRALLPEQADALLSKELSSWAGLRPMSANGLPFIGQLDNDNLKRLHLNTGHGHLGWTLSAGSAQLLAAQICGEKPPVTATPYRASRILRRG